MKKIPLFTAAMMIGLAVCAAQDAENLKDASVSEAKPAVASSSTESQPPIVGAIRWDAWTGGKVTKVVEKTLGPQKYHFRLPWFAEVASDGSVRIDGSPQTVMDQEIAFAADAGLDYWAFVLYREKDPMSDALRSYLQSKARNQLDFCVILHNSFTVPDEEWPLERDRALALLKEPGYQTVLGGRPLVYTFIDPAFKGSFPEKRFAEFQRVAKEAGLNPYYVFMGWSPEKDFPKAQAKGFDAVSNYARAANPATFAELSAGTEAAFWQKATGEGTRYVPLVTAGWDKQPRVDNPVAWEKGSDYVKNPPAFWPSTAKPEEIAAHLERALKFVKENPETCEAGAIIIYAWNEYDEGGWIAPTWTPSGKPDTGRLDAIGRVLKGKAEAPQNSTQN